MLRIPPHRGVIVTLTALGATRIANLSLTTVDGQVRECVDGPGIVTNHTAMQDTLLFQDVRDAAGNICDAAYDWVVGHDRQL